MMGMPIEVRDRWVAALRSGEYEQGKRQFRNGEAYCCLGVLCDVTAQPVRLHGGDNYPFVESLMSGSKVESLWKLNDVYDKTFPEIADWIEQHVEVVS